MTTYEITEQEMTKIKEQIKETKKKMSLLVKEKAQAEEQVQKLTQQVKTLEQQNKTEEIILFLQKRSLNSFALDNYFNELFVVHFFKTKRNEINLTKLECQLLQTILFKYDTTKAIQIYNENFKVNEKNTYTVKFGVTTSNMNNNQINYYNTTFNLDIPLNTLTEEEKQKLKEEQAEKENIIIIER